MRVLSRFLLSAALLAAVFDGAVVGLAQSLIIEPDDLFRERQSLPNGIENLRVVERNEAGTIVQITFDYSYNGFAGPVAQILPVIDKRGAQGAAGWFGADPVPIGRGRGTITIKIRYFNDEPGVPPTFTSDQVRMLILNQTGTTIVTAVPFLKKIEWGKRDSSPILARAQSFFSRSHKKELKAAKAKALAEVKASEDARKQAEEEAEQVEEELQVAEAEKRLADQKAQEDRAREIAEAQAKSLAKEEQFTLVKPANRKKAEEEDLQKAQVKSEAKQQAQEESERRLAETEKRLETLREKIVDRKREEEIARERLFAKLDEDVQLAAEQKQLLEQPAPAEAGVRPAQGSPAGFETGQEMKIKVTNVDVLNRSVDRTQLTIGIEFDYRDKLKDPLLGVELLSDSDPSVRSYFVSPPTEISSARRNFVLLPIKFQPPSGSKNSSGIFTDKLLVYLMEKATSRRYNLVPTTLFLSWQPPGGETVIVPQNINSVVIDGFHQHDPATGSLTVKYNLVNTHGRLRVKIYDSSRPDSAAHFWSSKPEISPGQNSQTIHVRLDPDVPNGTLNANTLEVELLDGSNQVLAKTSHRTSMVWSRVE